MNLALALPSVKLLVQIQEGTEITIDKMTMVVTEINDKHIKGYSKYQFDKFGKKCESMFLHYDVLLHKLVTQNVKIKNV